MDFVKGLPKSKGCDVMYVVVDRFTKYSHFFPISSHYTVRSVSQLFFEQVYKLHGMQSIVSDRDKIFTSTF